MLISEHIHPTLKNDEAAMALGVKPATLKKMRSRGQGPAYVRINRAVRYDPVDVAAYVGASRVQPRQGRSR